MIHILATVVMLAMAAQEQPSSPAHAASPPTLPAHQDAPFNFAYPVDALVAHKEGAALITLHISAKGRLKKCEIAKSSGVRSLDVASCAAFRSARFEPARDDQGRAVEGDMHMPINWRLPKH